MSWVLGFDVESGATSPSVPYRGGPSRRRRIAIRNPPGLSMLGACVGLALLIALAVFVVAAWLSDGPQELGLELRGPAVALGALMVLGGSLSALTPHTIVWIDGEHIVVERAKHSSPRRVRLIDVQHFEREPRTMSVRAVTAAGPVMLAGGLLPEQADLLLAALRPA